MTSSTSENRKINALRRLASIVEDELERALEWARRFDWASRENAMTG